MPSDVVLKNARLIIGDEIVNGSLSISDGRIVSIDSGSTSVTNAVDLEGDYLMPGMVEVHTDNFERHLMPRPKVSWSEVPALISHDAEIAAAGITTVFDALGVGEADADTVRGRSWKRVLAALDACTDEQLLRADHHLHVRCELPAPNTVELFAPFHGHPRLSLISVMDHTPGQRQWEDIEKARVYFTGRKGWSHDKFDDKVRQAPAMQAQFSGPHREYFVDYCRDHGIHLASHDDTTVDHVLQAHAEGASMSEFPTTVMAVVRGGSHSGNVAASDLARRGLLDILSSDYVPASLLGGMMRLVDDEILTMPRAVALVTSNPAKATGLTDRGTLGIGLRADFVRLRVTKVRGHENQAFVRTVWREGKQVV